MRIKPKNMKRVLDHETNLDHYRADAVIIWCLDDRFSKLFQSFAKSQGFRFVDLVKIVGGAKGLNNENGERSFILDQIQKSITLHHSPKIILVTHSDCGAYGMRFPNAEEEAKFHERELAKAAEVIESKFPGIAVEKYFAGVDGLYSME